MRTYRMAGNADLAVNQDRMTGFWNEREQTLDGVKRTPQNRYYHIATEVWQQSAQAAGKGTGAAAEGNGDGNAYAVCDGTGEDPTCSDSIGVMKWTIADHQVRHHSVYTHPALNMEEARHCSFCR